MTSHTVSSPLRALPVHFVQLLVSWLTILAFQSAAASISCDKLLNDKGRLNTLEQHFRLGQTDWTRADDFAESLKRLSTDKQSTWLSFLARQYRRFPKIGDRSDRTIGSRRAIERVFSNLQDLGGVFSARLLNGEGALKAYGEVIDQQAHLFNSPYRARDILNVARYFHDELKGKPETRSGERKIVLAGSFINGKAKGDVSDIDILLYDTKMERDLPRWQKDVQNLLRQQMKNEHIVLENHKRLSPQYYGTLNPFVIEVTHQEIKLLVFAPASIAANDPKSLLPNLLQEVSLFP